jgi:hypothetical protein
MGNTCLTWTCVLRGVDGNRLHSDIAPRLTKIAIMDIRVVGCVQGTTEITDPTPDSIKSDPYASRNNSMA